TWLILESLSASERVAKSSNHRAMRMAAGWIGRFHAASEMHLGNCSMPSLKTYDAEYYLGWVHRTFEFTRHLHSRFRWLEPLCARVESTVIPQLLSAARVVIHGEYYPPNILFRDGIVSPVDWESAAIAAGEIDLACLTEEWPAAVMRQCQVEYQRARWPSGSPAAFERTFSSAQLYVFFRWLGDCQEWTAARGAVGYLK